MAKVKPLKDIIFDTLIFEEDGKEEVIAVPTIGMLHIVRNRLPSFRVLINPRKDFF